MHMPFGKYKGWPVDEIPEDYLEWLIENVDLREPLASTVFEILISKTADKHDIKTVYRRLSFKYHPDRGGNKEAMQAINDFYEEMINVG